MTSADCRPAGSTDRGVTAGRFESDVVALMPALHSYAMRLTRNHADADDLLQDTMLKAFKSFHTFRPGTNIRAWLYRIQTNSYISSYNAGSVSPRCHSPKRCCSVAKVSIRGHGQATCGPPKTKPWTRCPMPISHVRCARCRRRFAPSSTTPTWRACPSSRSPR